MRAILKQSVTFYSIQSEPVTLSPGTQVEVDLNDGTASVGESHFDIEPEEYELLQGGVEFSQPVRRLALH